MSTRATPQAVFSPRLLGIRVFHLFLAPFLLFVLTAPVALSGDASPASLTIEEADSRLAVANRLLDGGVYGRAGELASSVLDDPAASGLGGEPGDNLA
jgi:hypothetical protein